jgi:hypothetical protein
MVVLDYKKNSKFEIEFTNLDAIKQGDDVVLFLKDGDLSPLVYLSQETKKIQSLFIPYIPVCDKLINSISEDLFNNDVRLMTFDILDSGCFNILPKWNIPEDNAVLFLNEDDSDRYNEIADNSTYFTYPNLESENDCLNQDYFSIKDYKKVSIIIPELHEEDKSCHYHIENVNKVCKELKEKYNVERIELFVSHCFIDVNDDNWFITENNKIDTYDIFKYIDKITTTNSTGVLEIQQSNRLEVIDCCSFFNI